MLITPFDLLVEDVGFNVLARATDELGAYQGLTVAVQRGWAEENRERLLGFLAGYLRGLQWLYDPANREAGVTLLRENVPQMDEQLAERAFDVLVNEETGFFPTGELDMGRLTDGARDAQQVGPGRE
jgi:ABC-type nitrate/sulfonate/bicarbonate transport system substrate-binding protein